MYSIEWEKIRPMGRIVKSWTGLMRVNQIRGFRNPARSDA